METDLYEASHQGYRVTARTFGQREVVPSLQRWDAERQVDRDAWKKAGQAGLVGLAVPERFGGAGVSDYRYRFVLGEEIANAGVASLQSPFGTNDDIVLGYLLNLGTEDQQARWLPGFATGETVAAIAMSEPTRAVTCVASPPLRARVGAQRVEDLHQQRHRRRPGRRGGTHRPGRGRPGLRPVCRRTGHPRVRPRHKLDKVGCRRRTRRNCSSATPGCRPGTCSATRAAGWPHSCGTCHGRGSGSRWPRNARPAAT